jgi:hypothetical protein
MTATILHLLGVGGPSTVLWRVRSVVVDALDGVLHGRRWTHVGQESLKGSGPPWVHRDTSSAVKLIVIDTRISAARLDGLPCPVFLGSFAASACAVSDLGFTHGVHSQAATTKRVAVQKEARLYQSWCAAAAFAQDAPAASLSQRSSNNTPTSECLTVKVRGCAPASSADGVALQASATLAGTAKQIVLLNGTLGPAVTATQPRQPSVLWCCGRDCEPSSKTLTNQVLMHRLDSTTTLEIA